MEHNHRSPHARSPQAHHLSVISQTNQLKTQNEQTCKTPFLGRSLQCTWTALIMR